VNTRGGHTAHSVKGVEVPHGKESVRVAWYVAGQNAPNRIWHSKNFRGDTPGPGPPQLRRLQSGKSALPLLGTFRRLRIWQEFV